MVALAQNELHIPASDQFRSFYTQAESLRDGHVKVESIDLDKLPKTVRDAIELERERLGSTGGRIVRMMQDQPRKGALAMFGNLPGDKEKKDREKARYLLEAMARYAEHYHRVGYKIAVLEEALTAIEEEIDTHITVINRDKKVGRLEKATEIRSLKDLKTEIVKFRKSKVQAYRKTLETGDLPETSELTKIESEIDETVKNHPLLKNAVKQISSIYRGLQATVTAPFQRATNVARHAPAARTPAISQRFAAVDRPSRQTKRTGVTGRLYSYGAIALSALAIGHATQNDAGDDPFVSTEPAVAMTAEYVPGQYDFSGLQGLGLERPETEIA